MPDARIARPTGLTEAPPPPRTKHGRPALVFVAAVSITILTVAGLELAGYPHAEPVFLVLLYGGILPALLWYWRENRAGVPYALSLPDARLPAIIAFAAITAITSFSYDHGHTLPDESSYLFQGRIFASGQLKAEPMPGARANPAAAPVEIYFEHQVQSANGWYSKYPPGWPLALAAGYLAGCPWIVNPALGVLLLLIIDRLARRWGTATRIVAVMLVACSSYAVLYSMGFLSHALIAAVATASLGAAFRGVREQRLRWICICFILVVIATEIRPYDSAVLFILCAGYTLMAFRENRWMRRRSFAIIIAAAVSSVALLLLVNRIYTGDFLLSPYAWSRGSGRIHELTLDPVRIAHNLAFVWRWAAVDTLSFTFPFVFLAAAYACSKETLFRRELITLALLFPLLFVAYLFQSESSSSFDGERYYYAGYAAICIVGARGFLLLIERRRVAPRAVARGLLALAIVQALWIGVMIGDVQGRLAPWRTVYRASVKSPLPGLVFLSIAEVPGSPDDFAAKHANWNQARWKTARTVFLNDPGPERRNQVACRFHRPSYRVVSYSGLAQSVTVEDSTATCPVRD